MPLIERKGARFELSDKLVVIHPRRCKRKTRPMQPITERVLYPQTTMPACTPGQI
jgi:hypothetical protein